MTSADAGGAQAVTESERRGRLADSMTVPVVLPLLVAALMALGGCASASSARAPANPGTDLITPLADDGAADIASEGLRVVSTYTAASGRLCRRLAGRDGMPVLQTSCRAADGSWRLGRALNGVQPSNATLDPLNSREP